MHATAAGPFAPELSDPSGAPLSPIVASGQLRGVHLIDADLRGQDLTGADLTGANLSRADLSNACLAGAVLDGATLFEANLTDTEFAGASLVGANLAFANAERAGFGAACLKDTHLDSAQLICASFTKADLTGATLTAAVLDKATVAEANFEDADLTRASLRDTDLSRSRLTRARFDQADLRSATLFGVHDYGKATFIGTDMRDINFAGAYLLRRHAMDQNYLAEFRSRSRLHRAIYKVWSITSDCGRSIGRWALWIAVLSVVFAFAYTGVSIDYGDHQTMLSPLYFSIVTMTTLGYGDVLPSSEAAQVIVMVQVLAGYVMLGGLLSIFSNKMARRAD